MSLSAYGTFLGFAIVLVLIPGPDFAVVTKNTLAGGRRRGWFTAAGVCTSNAVQGAIAVSGLSAIILKAQPVFAAIKWAGVCYLAFLGVQSLLSAVRGRYELADGGHGIRRDGAAFGGWRQGFLSNITNPKVLIFYRPAPPVPEARCCAWLAARVRLEPCCAVIALPAGTERRAGQSTSAAIAAGCPQGDGRDHRCVAARIQRPARRRAQLSRGCRGCSVLALLRKAGCGEPGSAHGIGGKDARQQRSSRVRRGDGPGPGEGVLSGHTRSRARRPEPVRVRVRRPRHNAAGDGRRGGGDARLHGPWLARA